VRPNLTDRPRGTTMLTVIPVEKRRGFRFRWLVLGVVAGSIGLSFLIPEGYGPAALIGRGLLFALLIGVFWPVWMIAWFILAWMVRRLNLSVKTVSAPFETASVMELEQTWNDSWSHEYPERSLHYGVDDIAVRFLQMLPREIAIAAVREHVDTCDAYDAAERMFSASHPTRKAIPWKRWLCVAAPVALIVAIIIARPSSDETSMAAGRRYPVERSDQPTWINVKYRSDPVDVANGDFSYWFPEGRGNVLEAWWDSRNDYLLINLGGTVYHYCNFSVLAWFDLTTSSVPDFIYSQLIRGNPDIDCRSHSVPRYP
jgi:hypothetical protein